MMSNSFLEQFKLNFYFVSKIYRFNFEIKLQINGSNYILFAANGPQFTATYVIIVIHYQQ